MVVNTDSAYEGISSITSHSTSWICTNCSVGDGRRVTRRTTTPCSTTIIVGRIIVGVGVTGTGTVTGGKRITTTHRLQTSIATLPRTARFINSGSFVTAIQYIVITRGCTTSSVGYCTGEGGIIGNNIRTCLP